MARKPITINDRVAEGDDIFKVETLTEGRIRLIPDPDSILEVGTDVNKELMQPWEDIHSAVTGSSEVQLKMLNSGQVVRVTNKGAYSAMETYSKYDYVTAGFVAKIDGLTGVEPPKTPIENDSWMPCAWD